MKIFDRNKFWERMQWILLILIASYFPLRILVQIMWNAQLLLNYYNNDNIKYKGRLLIKIYQMKKKCKKCGYEWESRIENPKCCPNCKQYMSGGVKNKKQDQQN